MDPARKPSEKTIQLSPVWILIGALGILMLGMVGGIAGARISGQATLPPAGERSPLVTNVQQVTISPNSAAATNMKNADRSVVLLAQEGATQPKILATGLIITNDGLVVTTAASLATLAIDSGGRTSPLDKVGDDSIYGLQYFRLKNGVFSPLALAEGSMSVASDLLLVSRSPESYQATARQFFVNEYVVPVAATSAISLVLTGITYADNDLLTGSPLLTEEGKIAGLLLNPQEGQVLSSVDLRRSLDRVASGQREADPFTTLGFLPAYAYLDGPLAASRSFAMQVGTLVPGGLLATAGVKTGDRISKIGETTVTAEANISALLSTAATLTVTRQSQELVISLKPVSLSS